MSALVGREFEPNRFRLVRARLLRAGAWIGLIAYGSLQWSLAVAQNVGEYTIQPLRWEEDYTYLRGRDSLPFPLSLKYVALPGDNSFVSLGGEYRVRVESYETPNFGLTHTPNYKALSHRVFAHADVHAGSIVRVFVQLGYSDESGRKPAERPFDRGATDLAQAFVDLNLSALGTPLRLRLGRQELSIGRYVTIRDGTAIRRTFDGVRLDGSLDPWTILATYARPTRNRPHAFDDEPDMTDRAAILVATRKVPRFSSLLFDLFLMQRDNQNARYLVGAGHELRDSLGTRLHGAMGAWDLDNQVSHQFGRFTPNGAGRLSIDSWGAAFEGGYTFRDTAGMPRLAARVDAAEGGKRPGSRVLTTFDIPYPNLSYLTDAAFIAPRNVWDIDPFVTVHPMPGWTIVSGAQFLWRLTSHDAIYSPIGTTIVPANTAGSFIAAQPYLRVNWRPSPFVELQLSGTRAQPGGAVKSDSGRAQNYWSGAVTVRF